jgi:hypothetical protein
MYPLEEVMASSEEAQSTHWKKLQVSIGRSDILTGRSSMFALAGAMASPEKASSTH